MKYNGPKTQLMDELLTALTDRYDIENCDDWATVELYLARACSVLEHAGWKKGNKKYKKSKNLRRVKMDRGILRTPVTKEAFEHSNEPERTPQIEEQVKRVYGALDGLSCVVNELGERLTKVLRQPYPEQKDEKKDRRLEEVLVPLAGDIRSISEHIEAQTTKLRDYLDRLEL